LDHKTDIQFCSVHFDSLFVKYSKRMVRESMGCGMIDAPSEVYSLLSSSFMKIVGMFDRNTGLTKTSDKWFSSFFWRAIQNKIADLNKTNNYIKRTPFVKCAVCGKELGQITIKHLSLPGHEVIIEQIFFSMGKSIMEDSGEIIYYSNDELKERACRIGEMIYYNKEKKEQKKFFSTEATKSYFSLFPNAFFRNEVVSTNRKVDHDSDSEMGDFEVDGVFSDTTNQSIIEDLNLKDMIESLIGMLFSSEENRIDLRLFFKTGTPLDKQKNVVRQILHDKSSYFHLKNKEVDSSIQEAKSGITDKVINLIKKDKECRMFLCNGSIS